MTANADQSPDADADPIVPPEIEAEYLRIRSAPRTGIADAKVYYFKEVIPYIRSRLEDWEEHKRLRSMGYTTLVSLMGFSPETTVLSTIILRPKKLLIVYSENARESAKPALKYLDREGLIDEFHRELIPVNAFDPVDIYKKIRDKLTQTAGVIFDVTGGSKVMSATAGALAWELNLPLCYLDGSWDPSQGSSGMKKLSKMKAIPNPSRLQGVRVRNEALDNYDRGNFPFALKGFQRSRELIDDSHFDDLGMELARCYCNLADFDCEGLKVSLARLESTLSSGGVKRLHEAQLKPRPHIDALRRFASGETGARTAVFAVLSEMYTRQGRYDFAGLLAYRAMEALVEDDFQRRAPGFNTSAPVWEALTDDVDGLRKRYTRLNHDGGEALPNHLTHQTGFGVLCALDELLSERLGSRKASHAFGEMRRLSNIRNRSYMTHGFEKLTEEDSRSLREHMNLLAAAILGEDHAEFEILCGHLRPLPLRDLNAF